MAGRAEARNDARAEYIAGGTDMVQLLQEDVRRPEGLVSLAGLLDNRIEVVAQGLTIGASATMAEVAVDRKTGHVQVKRVVTALDVGLVVNPDGLRQQMEGCIAMGLGYALTEEVHFKDGEVLDRNFDSYQIPRFSWMPKLETILIDNPGTPALGGGEPPIVTVGAVIANAIYDAAGVRLRQLPMTPARVLEALKKG